MRNLGRYRINAKRDPTIQEVVFFWLSYKYKNKHAKIRESSAMGLFTTEKGALTKEKSCMQKAIMQATRTMELFFLIL